MAQQPALDRGGLVGGVVVDDDVHVDALGHVVVDQVQEAAELLGAVAWCEVGDDFAGGDVERCVEVGGAVALVVMGAPLGGAGYERQDGGGAVERLDLGFLIHAQHHRRVRRVEIETHDIADLVDEHRVR